MNDLEPTDRASGKGKRIDLNLLIFFDAVYQTGSVKLAASLLNCSSPNVSQSLQRLRDLIGDPLFIRNGQKLSATTVAIRLHEETKNSLHELQYSFENFSEKSKRKLIIECMPYFSIKLIPLITSFLETKNIDCEILNLEHSTTESTFGERLSLKKVDIIFGVNADLGLSREKFCITTGTGILVCRKNHPRLDKSYVYGTDPSENVAKILTDIGVIKKMRTLNADFFQNSFCSLQAKSFLSICSHIAVSNSVAIIPRSFYEQFKDVFNLKSLETNLDMPVYSEYMYFNKTTSDKVLYLELFNYIKDNYDNPLY
ncbi:LysR family transcriptional regulator [Buttiauxella sp.]|uniref:LysR family transcriptional regulator n=1 Tax=Buttiauxella sp. TaxID=1972222 RepID=UPI003C72F8B0